MATSGDHNLAVDTPDPRTQEQHVRTAIHMMMVGRAGVSTPRYTGRGPPARGLLLLGARGGDLVGRGRALLVGLALFGLASLLIGVAQGGEWLIATRARFGVSPPRSWRPRRSPCWRRASSPDRSASARSPRTGRLPRGQCQLGPGGGRGAGGLGALVG